MITDNRTHYYGLSAGHGKRVDMEIYGTDMQRHANRNCVLGTVTKVWNDTSPVTCDAALFYMGADLRQSNTVFTSFTKQQSCLETLPGDPEQDDVIFKFCDGGTAMSDVVGRVENVGYFYKGEPLISDCIAIRNIDNETEPFSLEGDSGMVVTATPEEHGGIAFMKGLAVIIATDCVTTIDGRQRHLTIVEPLRRVMTTIREDPSYQFMEIVSVGVNIPVAGRQGCS